MCRLRVSQGLAGAPLQASRDGHTPADTFSGSSKQPLGLPAVPAGPSTVLGLSPAPPAHTGQAGRERLWQTLEGQPGRVLPRSPELRLLLRPARQSAAGPPLRLSKAGAVAQNSGDTEAQSCPNSEDASHHQELCLMRKWQAPGRAPRGLPGGPQVPPTGPQQPYHGVRRPDT